MPEKTNEHITGSTMIPEEMQTPHVNTRKISTDNISMHGIEADGITTSPDSSDPKKLLTSFVLHQVRNDLNQSMKMLKSTVDELTLSPVLTPAVATPNFTDLSKWDMSSQWYSDNGHAFFVNKLEPAIDQGTLRLNKDAFLHPGTYFYNLDVTEIPEGAQLTIMNYKREVIEQITVPGNYQGTFEVDHPGTFYLDFRADNCPKFSQIVLDYAGVHYLKPEFKEYMSWAALHAISGDSGFITVDEVNAALNSFQQNLQNYVNVAVNTINDTFGAHLRDRTTNPHGITPGMIAAAPAVHSHSLSDIVGISTILTKPLEDALATLSEVKSKLSEHLTATNPHGITLEYLHGAEKNHSHVIDDIDGLETRLTTIQNTLASQSSKDIQTVTEQLNTFITNVEEFRSSVENFENEINKWKDYINSLIENGPESFGVVFATPAEAQEGVNNTKYMNPQLTQVGVQAWAAWKDVDVTKRYGRSFGKFALSAFNPEIAVEINPAGIYQLVFLGNINYDIRKLCVELNGDYSNDTSTYVSTNDLSNEIIDEKYLKILPSSSAITRVFGQWLFIPESATISGFGVGYTGDLTNEGSPIYLQSMTAHLTPGKMFNTSLVKFKINNPTEEDNIEFFLYELVGTQENGFATDANPAGTIVEMFGTAPQKDYSLLDGSLLRRDIYEDLYKYAVSRNAIISQEEYDNMIATTGYCASFHSGDGETTFGLPKLNQIGPIYKYIKLKNTFLASPGQLFFEYVWSNS